MKKKFVLCSLVLSLLFAMPCSAEIVSEKPQFLSDGYVSIEGKSDVKNGQIAFKAARVKGEEIDYAAIKETVSDDEGKFKFLFRIPEQIDGASSNGTYTYWIVSENDEEKEDTFDYISFEYILKNIRDAKSGAELYTIINNCTEDDEAALEAMGVAVDDIDGVKAKLSDITNLWFSLCNVATDESADIADAFNKAMGLEYARAKNIEKALELINPVYGTVKFEAASNKTALTTVVESNADTESLEKFNDSYELSNKIIEFRELGAAKLVEAINTYEQYFDFSSSSKYSSYSKMNLTKQGRVADKMSELIGNDTVKVSEIVSAFESAVKAVEGSGTTGGSFGGSSGSSSGRGSTGSYSSGATVNEYQVETIKEQTEGFSDLADSEWAVEAITALAGKGIVSGSGDGKFNPNNSVTREEFTKMTILAIGMYDSNAECDFSDVGKDEWYYSYIASAAERGIINGIGDGSFGTGTRITREDMAVIVKRAAEAVGISFAQIKPLSEFSDSYMIADYARESIEELYCAGVINGVGGNAFAPTENCTRAQAAKIIYEAFVK